MITHFHIETIERTIQPVILDQNYIQLKNLVIKAERRVLKELGFCVHIKHPHKIIVMYLQVLGYEKNQKLMQYSWNYMNDSLRTDVFVRYQPETVASACIYLTARKLKLPLPKNPQWYKIFNCNESDIRDISIRILKLYTRPKPNIELLEKNVDELCRQYHDARVKARINNNSSSNNNNSGNNTPNNNNNNNNEQSPNQQKSIGAHNAWGGFISRSGSHVVPLLQQTTNEKQRSRSRSTSQSPLPSSVGLLKRMKRSTSSSNSNNNNNNSKKHRSRSPIGSNNTNNNSRNHHRHHHHHKKNHKRRSYTRSRSNSPQKLINSNKLSGKRRSITPINKKDRRSDDKYYSSGSNKDKKSKYEVRRR